MIKYTVGEIIRRERKKQKLSQESLCDGICTPSWLSKIESGSCIPTPALFEALMQRLGKNASQYIMYLSETDMHIEHLKIEIRRNYAIQKFPEAIRYFEEFEKLARDDHKGDQQFLNLMKILLYNKHNLNSTEMINHMYSVLEYTIENFDINNLENYLLSKDEILIINNIAIQKRTLGNLDQAIEILKRLRLYLENPRFDYEEKLRTYPTIMNNLAKWQKISGDSIGCLNTCETAIEFCIKYDKFTVFPDLLFYKGCSLMVLGGENAAIKCFRESYYFFSATKNMAFADHVLEYCETQYQLKLIV